MIAGWEMSQQAEIDDREAEARAATRRMVMYGAAILIAVSALSIAAQSYIASLSPPSSAPAIILLPPIVTLDNPEIRAGDVLEFSVEMKIREPVTVITSISIINDDPSHGDAYRATVPGTEATVGPRPRPIAETISVPVKAPIPDWLEPGRYIWVASATAADHGSQPAFVQVPFIVIE